MLNGGDIVALRCEGHVEGNRFLDGRTAEGAVGLVPNTDVPPFTGTWWWSRDAGGGEIFLECMGHLNGNRFLDGRTHDGTVGLAPHTDPPFTGARWRPHDAGEGLATIECLGDLPGNRFLDGHTHDGTLGLAPNTDAPFTGTLWRVTSATSNFTFADDIPAENRDRLIERHKFALAMAVECGNLSEQEKEKLYQAYRRPIHHTTLGDPDANASANINGSTVNVNFGVLFPKGNEEISQTLIHEMMHCAGFEHDKKRKPPTGKSCSDADTSGFDCPNDNGPYYSTPPLRAEFCIAGAQSDVALRLESKAEDESCEIDEDGVATIKTV